MHFLPPVTAPSQLWLCQVNDLHTGQMGTQLPFVGCEVSGKPRGSVPHLSVPTL